MGKKNKRGQGSLFKRGRIWWIKFHVHGVPHRESSKSADKRDADRLLKQRLGEVATGAHIAVSNIRVDALLDLFLEDYIEHERHDLYIAKKRINAHVRPMLGHIRAAEFGSEDIKHYIKARRDAKCCLDCRKGGNGAKNSTINRELSIVRRAFILASELDPPRVVRVPHVPKLPEGNNAREGFLEHWQYEALRMRLPAHAALALSIGYHTGMRRGLILELRWEWVDLAASVIRIPSADTETKKRPRVVPIYGDMRQLLEMARSAAQTPYVIEFRGERVHDIKKAWATACRACGFEGIMFHDLRRTAATNALLAGIPEVNIMEMCGWRTNAMLKRYAQALDKRAQDTGRKMEQFMERQQATTEKVKTQ